MVGSFLYSIPVIVFFLVKIVCRKIERKQLIYLKTSLKGCKYAAKIEMPTKAKVKGQAREIEMGLRIIIVSTHMRRK